MTNKTKSLTKPKPKAVVLVMPYRAQVALFDGAESMKEYFREVLNIQLEGGEACDGSCISAADADGINWYGIALEDDANLSTLVHECSHIVDFIFDFHGVPTGKKNTEVRAYTLGELVEDVAEVFNFSVDRKK